MYSYIQESMANTWKCLKIAIFLELKYDLADLFLQMTPLLDSYSIGLLCKWISDLREVTVVVVFVFDLYKYKYI